MAFGPQATGCRRQAAGAVDASQARRQHCLPRLPRLTPEAGSPERPKPEACSLKPVRAALSALYGVQR